MKFYLVVEFKSDLDLFPRAEAFNAPNCKTAFKKAQKIVKDFIEEGTTVIEAKLTHINEHFQEIYEVASFGWGCPTSREWHYYD